MSNYLIEAKSLSVTFNSYGFEVPAVREVDFYLDKREVVGVVGESGSGKSTFARVLAGLQVPTSGEVTFKGENIFRGQEAYPGELRKAVQMVFQDPYSSLNPRQQIENSIAEAIEVHGLVAKDKITDRVTELLVMVGLDPDLRNRYPHQLSGGQRQRVCIARALSAEPKLLVLDEPVSALDVSVRAEVMNLLIDLRKKLGLTYIFISHDLAMIRYISDVIAVMYLGKIVEFGTWEEIIENPVHPYTKALIAAMPDHSIIGDPTMLARTLEGEVPDPVNLPSGCSFHSRCVLAVPSCSITAPTLRDISNGHLVACSEV